MGADSASTTVLYRPVGTKELELIEQSGWRAFPPRLPEQPIFYPVTNRDYAIEIARDWNVRHNDDKKGYVTRFAVDAAYLAQFDKKIVGASTHEEYWIPAEDLDVFNQHIRGLIEVTDTFVEQGEHAGSDAIDKNVKHYPEASILGAHGHSSKHRAEVLASAVCGCFFCTETFATTEITEWVDNDQTAICPLCYVDSVIGEKSGWPVQDQEFLIAMNRYWF